MRVLFTRYHFPDGHWIEFAEGSAHDLCCPSSEVEAVTETTVMTIEEYRERYGVGVVERHIPVIDW